MRFLPPFLLRSSDDKRPWDSPRGGWVGFYLLLGAAILVMLGLCDALLNRLW